MSAPGPVVAADGLTEEELTGLQDPRLYEAPMPRGNKHRTVLEAAQVLERSPGLWFRFYGPWPLQSRGAHQAASHLRLGQRYGAQLGGRRLEFRATAWRGRWWVFARFNPDAEPIPTKN